MSPLFGIPPCFLEPPHTSASCLQATKVSYSGAVQRCASELSCIFSCQGLGPEVPSWSPTYLGSSHVLCTGFFPSLRLFSLQQRDDVSESSVQMAECLVVTVCLKLRPWSRYWALFSRAQRTGIVAVHSEQRAGESLPPQSQ